ncbi:PA2779 family protein [Sulfurospirillum barnesii]|uniref:PA2779 family protein n=1 Tax=Sulfurospirillum barnesii (strain ATCC 700032 / DSM 10660 / SES-3) TaxID=760154 RepID=I3XWM2_SULBS|nr:PA2779 family protein [Sulfurospirillum barnesii]AFL68346.1 hypothetical protein Sulba_1048 [Sulfurospirillum barnesii SES-3]
MNTAKLLITFFMSLSLFSTTLFAEVISTKHLLHASNSQVSIDTFLNKQEVQEKLLLLGVSHEDLQGRIATLTDEEIAQINHEIDTLPAGAGAGAIIGVIVFIFLVLLITDILGYTKVYNFTKSAQ